MKAEHHYRLEYAIGRLKIMIDEERSPVKRAYLAETLQCLQVLYLEPVEEQSCAPR